MRQLLSRLRPLVPSRESLARTTMRRAALRISLIVLIASGVGYLKVLDGLETQAIDSLERYVEARRERESIALREA